ALLRGINVGGKTSIPMAELRALAEGIGLSDVRTYIQSGNLLFDAEQPDGLEQRLEEAIGKRFLPVPVIVRSADEWAGYAGSNPFPDAAEAEPNRLMMMLSKRTPEAGAAAALQERAKDGERVALAGGALWIHYPGGSGTSKLSPSLIDRLVGSPATARNWRTVCKIREMLR
ncbi:MAG TPA: DUF1697 domain-containing protein, partial [Allosphingosinicella sp.]